VFASLKQLERQIDGAAREGFACVAMARVDPGIAAPGVAVVLGRPAGTNAPVTHLVVAAAGSGADLQQGLDRGGAEGFRLCGVVLDEEPPAPRLVAVMSRPADASPSPLRYGVEVLTNYKNSLVRLNAAGRDGFVPVAAAPVNNNRVVDIRSWLVVAERRADGKAREVAVRSNSGAEGLQKALNEQSGQGYRIDLFWKEGLDAVVMMSRPVDGPKSTSGYGVDVTDPSKVHSVARTVVGDMPYLTSGDRLFVSDRGVMAVNDVEEEPLPPLNSLGDADSGALERLGDHLTRHQGARPAAVRIRRGPGGALLLSTILTTPQ
jgi:hypothetical protein